MDSSHSPSFRLAAHDQALILHARRLLEKVFYSPLRRTPFTNDMLLATSLALKGLPMEAPSGGWGIVLSGPCDPAQGHEQTTRARRHWSINCDPTYIAIEYVRFLPINDRDAEFRRGLQWRANRDGQATIRAMRPDYDPAEIVGEFGVEIKRLDLRQPGFVLSAE